MSYILELYKGQSLKNSADIDTISNLKFGFDLIPNDSNVA